MTMTEHPQRERNQHDQAAQANQQHAAEQRQAAAHVSHAVAVARSERTRAAHLGADTRRLEDAFDILSDQVNGREEMTVLRPGNALRHDPGGPEQGTASVAAICEFVERVRQGELPFDVLDDMHAVRLERHLAGAAQHAQSMYLRADRLENAAVVQPALPPGPASLASSNAVSQQRQPIAPLQPPMFPPAPPETPTEQTGAIFSRLRENGHDIPAEIERAARKDHGSSLETRVPDPVFAAAALPQQRMGDTQRLPMDDVLEHLAQADAGAASSADEDDERARERRPFSGTGLSGDASPARDSGASDDDES